MSSEDSFINEVTEEVRRERLFGYLKRYGWIAITVILVFVGGAGWNEWRKAEARKLAESRGDAIIAALDAGDAAARAAAIGAIEAEGTAGAVISMIAAAEGANSENRAAALDRLEALAIDPELDALYGHLAALKVVSLRGQGVAPEDRLARLEPLSFPGAPYRPLALELMALAHVDAGDTDAALKILTRLVSDAEAPQGLRRRASQLIVALGGSLDAS